MTAPAPRVSVCVPVYNCERFLREAIQSALSQTYRDFELLIVDNASTDSTAEVITGFDDPRIVVHRNATNIGAAGNWNRAVELSRGEYVKLLCADDLLEPTCLAEQVAALDAAPRASLSTCARTIVGEGGAAQMTRGWGRANRTVPSEQALRHVIRSGTNLMGDPSAVLFRRSAFDRVGEFRVESGYAIDMDLWVRLLEVGDAAVIAQPLSRYRVSGGSWSVAVDSVQARDTIAVLRSAVDRNPGVASKLDLAQGIARAKLNQSLRWLFYRVFMRAK